MGRSSLYNQLKLGGTEYFRSIGFTLGWGHFHITDVLFSQMRGYLRLINHPYAAGNRFGQGPNWRLRTIRAALAELGINEDVLRHGIQREVFFCPLAANAEDILRTGQGRPNLNTLLRARDVSRLAKERWIIPRAARDPIFRTWKREAIEALILTGGNAHRNLRKTA
jgi:hypothetical protein